MDGDEEYGSLESEARLCSVRSLLVLPPIDLNDSNHEVVLLDISNNKEWIAYITYKIDYTGDYNNNDERKSIFITRRRFTAVNRTGEEEIVSSGEPVTTTTDTDHLSFEITDFVKSGGGRHCKFLSVSQDGKYVVLSFFERNTDNANRRKPPGNPNCLIFEMKKDLEEPLEIKCKGRAVFLNQRHSLAIISPNTIKIYDNFPESESVTFMFDLRPFRSTATLFQQTIENQESFIQNASWLDISKTEDDNDMRRLITLTRHIRHNLLTTPFNGGIVRIWSIIEDGTRLTSFPAPNQHVMAFSKNYKYTAAYVENTRSINIYNVKSGLLVYQLNSRETENISDFTVSHIRFCYDGRYVAMAGWEKNNVVFEVWYVEAEKSVYRTVEALVTRPASYRKGERMIKVVQPFVSRRIKDRKKCLKGYYTSYPNGEMTTMCVELDIDQVSDKINIDWIKNKPPHCRNTFEIENSLQNNTNLRCGNIKINEKDYLIRFGKHTVQLWYVTPKIKDDVLIQDEDTPNIKDDGLIKDEDKLLYIRAYKGPDYGIDYSFRETWRIDTFKSIKFIGGDPSKKLNPSGRLLVNITELTEETSDEVSNSYHTEEIFLPLDELSTPLNPTTSTATQSDTFLRFDYHKLESACQALHFLFNPEESFTNIEDQDKFSANLTTIRKKTEALIVTSLSNLDIESNYFSTIAGSRTLAMLASFKTGRRIIFMIVNQSIPISIFSYVRSQSEINRSNPEETKEDRVEREEYEHSLMTRTQSQRTEGSSLENSLSNDPGKYNMPTLYPGELSYRSAPFKLAEETKTKNVIIASNENVLTVLIHELSYDLYKLLFNRILSDSKKLGPGCLSSLTDALLFLQEEGNSDLLLSSSQKLSYLEIEKDRLAILSSEIFQVMKVKEMQKESISSIRSLESHATMEQIKKYEGPFPIQVYHIRKRWRRCIGQSIWWKDFKKPFVTFYKFKIRNPLRKSFIKSKKEAKQLSKVCVIPLPHFNSYSSFPEDRPKNTKLDDGKVIPYKKNSAFVSVASDQHDNNMFRQGDTVLEVLLEYKWQNFARKKFIWICLIHTVYYISYCTCVLFAPELYGINLEDDFVWDHPGQIVSLILMISSLFILVFQEIRQFIKTQDRIDYFLSGYNWVDICSFVFPLITLMQLAFNWPHFTEVCSVATLILWTHAILRLRVISSFGITLETIIQLSKNIRSVLFIMLLVILAFTQSYMVLLRLSPDEYFQDNFEGSFAGDVTSETGSSTAEGTVGFAASSADNGFTDPFKAFYQVWLFIYGVWDPIIEGDAGDSKMIMALSIVFSLITVLIFFNMVIALMSSTVEAVEKRGKKVWVSHFAAVVSEIELLWCSKKTKYSRKNNPTYIYYIASFDSISIQEKKLLKETKDLTAELKETFSNKT